MRVWYVGRFGCLGTGEAKVMMFCFLTDYKIEHTPEKKRKKGEDDAKLDARIGSV